MSSRSSVVPPLICRGYSTLLLRQRCTFVAPTRGSLGAVRGTTTRWLPPTDYPTSSGSGGEQLLLQRVAAVSSVEWHLVARPCIFQMCLPNRTGRGVTGKA